MKTALRFFLFNVAVLAFASPAHAAATNPVLACMADAKTFCQGVQPGGGRILDCLKDHYNDISDECYTALNNMGSGRGGGHNSGSSSSNDDNEQDNSQQQDR